MLALNLKFAINCEYEEEKIMEKIDLHWNSGFRNRSSGETNKNKENKPYTQSVLHVSFNSV